MSQVGQDEDGEQVADYPAPREEPRCWTHNSDSCGCTDEEMELAASAGDTDSSLYSKEPPFPPGSFPVSDLDLEPRTW